MLFRSLNPLRRTPHRSTTTVPPPRHQLKTPTHSFFDLSLGSPSPTEASPPPPNHPRLATHLRRCRCNHYQPPTLRCLQNTTSTNSFVSSSWLVRGGGGGRRDGEEWQKQGVVGYGGWEGGEGEEEERGWCECIFYY